ncbi:MAG: DNA mismatch repair endonuclease MutL [Fimbriimonadaceae bacterium]|nr:DNA mismatch repair endonuclease MutL [Fimbriimonadaceae bacterium]
MTLPTTTPASARRVRLLDPHTVNQIAAGEVVERPASVVKELVENALDAGGRRIEVDLEECGRKRVRVADDGCGMAPEDAFTSLERHATSKIASAEDLSLVTTLGFRGEALPSIASVSRFRLATAPADGARFVLEAEGGEVRPLDAREAGPRGTEVVVEDLFYNTPARLKFLKSNATELSACLDALAKAALAHPDVAFTVRHNGQLALRTTGSGDLLAAILDVWGRDAARTLVPVDTEAGGIRVRGFVGMPHATRPTRAYQVTFVNGRPIRSRTLMAAIDQAYRDYTPDRRYPTVALFLELDPARVDVNVSPTKAEVRFQQEGTAFEAVRYAIRAALQEHGMIPRADGTDPAKAALRPFEAGSASATGESAGDPAHGAFARLLGFGSSAPAGTAPGESGWGPGFGHGASRTDLDVQAQMPLGVEAGLPSVAGGFDASAEGDRTPFAFLLRNMRVVGQLMNTFILVETSLGLAIVDQHVAHERVLYEYLCGIRGQGAIERQALLTPETLHLDRRAAVLFAEQLDEVRALGFDIESFGGESFLVRSAPAAIQRGQTLKVLRDLADELVDGMGSKGVRPTREQIWITTSCKMAVKAGDPLGTAEMERLIVELAGTENPYMCPHGRPITVLMTVEELLRRFKR